MSSALRRFIFSTALAAAVSVTAVAAPAKAFAQETDLGPTDASTVVTASLVLKVRFPDLLEAFVALTQEPGFPTYHRFLSTHDFSAIFAPSPSDIATITKYLAGFGIVVTEVYADRLLIRATGTTDAFNAAFAVDVHNFQQNGKHYHRPRHAPKIPLLLRDLLVTVFGPSDEAMFRAHNVRASSLNLPVAPHTPVLPPKGATATHSPGDFTVGDVAERYNVNPLYNNGIDGTGNTVGIITLANMVPQDAYDYWAMIGLNVDQNRITQVHVDGGGELSADAGSGESSLDVEQSGGMAPGAKMVVYDAPNTNASFIDLFYRAASDNLVDTLSVSWGLAEIYHFNAVVGEDDTPQIVAFHQALLEMAAQGISMFASSGDSGAYDGNDAFNDPVDNVLAVDVPGSDPAITSSGGTTVPFTFTLLHPPTPDTPPLVVSTERVWAWDYLQDYLVEFLDPSFQDALFPEGGGGGVSIFWKLPVYQAFTKGIRKSEPNQSVVFQGEDLLDLPAGFAGRNVPDVSLNADPETGYIIISSADGGFIDGFGGTSFVAPQLNGITNLLVQANHGRLGLMNPMYYRFQRQYGYGKGSPFVDITTGSNWFYDGVKGYEPGAGLGVLNVANLADAVNRESGHRH